MALDNDAVKNKTSLLKSHLNEQMKTHIVYDGSIRPKYIFTAEIDAAEGDPCLVTEYVYHPTSTSDIIHRQERVYKWKAVWDAAFVFDPSVDYDADGDGNL